ncbi:HD domain-containing protein [Nocardia brasiliensis]|uniref:HD domain-containing protein n=1 Tax=Nocardia brasiliensis TaxID=37326 RepID=UPI0037B3AF60
MNELVRDAQDLAKVHLAAELPRRWRHVAGVARQGTRIAHAFGADGDLLVAACWLHDIGYSPALATTKFHPLDGARFLQGQGWSERICNLVAHHSCAIREAKLRNLDQELAPFDDEQSALRDALWYCDLTTSPDGETVSAEDRMSEIMARYGQGSLVYEFITDAREDLLAAIARTQERVESQI